MSCAAHGAAAQAARVLLREEALGHDLEEIDIEERAADGDAEHEPLVAQHPAQSRIVFVVNPLETRPRRCDKDGRDGFRRADLRNLAQSMGVVVSETSSETAMATLRVTANSRKSLPMMPPMSRMGMKTAISEVLIESTVKPISFDPFIAAS